jgi:hypothetical protein
VQNVRSRLTARVGAIFLAALAAGAVGCDALFQPSQRSDNLDGGVDGGDGDGDDMAEAPCTYVASTDMAEASTTHVAYRLSEGGHIFRTEASAGATPEDVSALLAPVSAGADAAIGLSRDGRWIGLLTTRFGCGDWECLALLPTDPNGATSTAGFLVSAGGQLVHSESRPAIARDAAFLVYRADGGPHSRDLWLVRRSATCGSRYDAPVLLTAASTFDTQDLPALSPDETSVVFDCANQNEVALCSVNLDGTGFQTVMTLKSGPSGGSGGTEVHSADFLPDGSMVFESDWMAEQVWSTSSGAAPTQYAPAFTNDNSPCALPDGRVASLWLERVGNARGYHELKVMSSATDYEMVVTGVDVNDIGIACGR